MRPPVKLDRYGTVGPSQRRSLMEPGDRWMSFERAVASIT